MIFISSNNYVTVQILIYTYHINRRKATYLKSRQIYIAFKELNRRLAYNYCTYLYIRIYWIPNCYLFIFSDVCYMCSAHRERELFNNIYIYVYNICITCYNNIYPMLVYNTATYNTITRHIPLYRQAMRKYVAQVFVLYPLRWFQ